MMEKLLLIKSASEIFLKGLNRNSFERKLKNNIKNVLRDVEYEFVTDMGRWFIYSKDIEDTAQRVKKVFGVAEVCIVTKVEAEFDAICQQALNEINENGEGTFKVVTNRANKTFHLNSMEVSRKVGAYILTNSENLKVDVVRPQFVVNVEIRENAYVYSKRIKGEGGMPYGTNGKTMLMLSGGIDSPVAGYMMARRGVEVSCVYYHSHPYTSERAKEKVKDLARILKGYTGQITLYVVPFTNIQLQIIEKCREDELTILMRRFFVRIACKIADMKGIQSVTTGESIGQVASQTMEALVVSDDASDRPIFRPLIAMDKIDIMDMSRNIGAYETSILPYEDCCTIFVPKHPKTKPLLHHIKSSEDLLEVERLVDEAVSNMEVFEV